MTESHSRWSRATSEIVENVRRILLSRIEGGQSLESGLPANLVEGLPAADLLDLAQTEYKAGTVLSTKFYLDAAQTPLPEADTPTY